jgi:hypothetical protein
MLHAKTHLVPTPPPPPFPSHHASHFQHPSQSNNPSLSTWTNASTHSSIHSFHRIHDMACLVSSRPVSLVPDRSRTVQPLHPHHPSLFRPSPTARPHGVPNPPPPHRPSSSGEIRNRSDPATRTGGGGWERGRKSTSKSV